MVGRVSYSVDEVDHQVRATDLFPELSSDIDRRIQHSETRIKFWIIGGVLANLLVAMAGALPIIYSLGQMTTQFDAALKTMTQLKDDGVDADTWREERLLWEFSVEQHLRRSGYIPPTATRRSK